MTYRRRGVLASAAVTASLALAAPLAVLGPPAVAASATAKADCGDYKIVKSTRNGFTYIGDFKIVLSCGSNAAGRYVDWWVQGDGGSEDIGSGSHHDEWDITIDTGSVVPRVASASGSDLHVQRTKTSAGWQVRVRAQPVYLLGDCKTSTWPWTCPTNADHQFDGYLRGQLNDYSSWPDAAQRDAFFGMNYATSVLATSLPKAYRDGGSGAMAFDLGSPQKPFYSGSSPYEGAVRWRIPNSVLKTVFGIGSPSSVTAAALDARLSGSGGGTVSVTDTGSALVVEARDLTFGKSPVRRLTVNRGSVSPAAPTRLAAARTGPGTAKLTFVKAAARGSAVTGHEARCVARTGSHVVTDRESDGPPQYVVGLRGGVAYDCKVRGLSKAGPGAWTAAVRVPATT
jgi:hypothetical protein